MQLLPEPPASFKERKVRILEQLAVPEGEYTDASPKGTVDAGIRELIDELNAAEGFVTTSSCAGRVSVFLEGNKTAAETDNELQRQQVAGVGGKGGGGAWLFVSHDRVKNDSHPDWAKELGFAESDSVRVNAAGSSQPQRLIHFKFEPMILHILTASPAHAQLILRCGLTSGFRESGAVNIAATDNPMVTPIVAIRSMGLSFESLVGYQDTDGKRHLYMAPEHLQKLMDIGNERFNENEKRIERFRNAFRDAVRAPEPKQNPDGVLWEDSDVRRDRMRAEGLRRQAEKLAGKKDAQMDLQFNDLATTP